MDIVKQLSIFIANKPGTLADICEELSKYKINIYALTISDTTDHAVIRMVVSDTQKTMHLLERRGLLVVDNNVLMIENSNKPGSLADIARCLGKAKINIEYAYLATSPESKKGLLIVRTDKVSKALAVLKKQS